jgi:energy-coupling factor transporter ATP-binding protein EcfA2
MAAAAYIRQYVGNVFQKKNQSLINKMVEKLMGLLHKHRIPIKMRAAVVGALQFATTKDTRNIIRQAYSQNLIKLL